LLQPLEVERENYFIFGAGGEAQELYFSLNFLGFGLMAHDTNHFENTFSEIVLLDVLSEFTGLQLGEGEEVLDIEAD